MKNLMIVVTAALIGVALTSCEFKKNVSREEIPIIKESVGRFETAVRMKNTAAIDSLLAGESEETATSILAHVYSDSLGNAVDSFVAFGNRQIFFRGDAARVDCSVATPDGPVKDITITMKKEGEVWLVKRVERRRDDPLAEEDDD